MESYNYPVGWLCSKPEQLQGNMNFLLPSSGQYNRRKVAQIKTIEIFYSGHVKTKLPENRKIICSVKEYQHKYISLYALLKHQFLYNLHLECQFFIYFLNQKSTMAFHYMQKGSMVLRFIFDVINNLILIEGLPSTSKF